MSADFGLACLDAESRDDVVAALTALRRDARDFTG
jgi:hypothetical protein